MKKYKELEKESRKGLTGKESLLISTLARLDKKIFGIEDARAVIEKDTGRIMSSLMNKKWVLPLKRGLYAIVPLDVGVKGADSFVLHNFVIASHLAEPYYVGYWSALNHHGLSEQIPRTTFIATTRAKMPLNILDADYYFVKLGNRKFFGFEKTDIEGWKVNISSPEKTLADCLDHPEHSGGVEEVARVIYLNHEEIDVKKVYRFGEEMGNNTILKRLGCILEATALLDKYREFFSHFTPSRGYTALDPISPRRGRHNSRWGLLVNFDLRPERWMY